MPSKEWDGHDEANGGYIIVSSDGDVLAYHIYNRDYFEKYLLDNTKLQIKIHIYFAILFIQGCKTMSTC